MCLFEGRGLVRGLIRQALAKGRFCELVGPLPSECQSQPWVQILAPVCVCWGILGKELTFSNHYYKTERLSTSWDWEEKTR